MQSPNIQLSIALVTRNGPHRLERCLRSVRSQSLQPFEIVVSDDSTPEFASQTRVIAEHYGCRYIEGPRSGLYANRNASALACRGTHIRTLDDDHILPEGHLALCMAAVASDRESIWTTGETGFVDEVFYQQEMTANQLQPSGAGLWPENLDDNWTIADGSTIYPASIFARGFRMIEEGYGSSYLEFGAFLYHNGYKSRCIRNAMVEHHAGRGTIDRDRKFDRKQAESCLRASLSYNCFFKPNLFLCLKYVAATVWHSRFDPLLIARIPIVYLSVRKRWRTPAAHDANAEQ